METRRVLLIEDDPGSVRMVFSLLRDEPYRLLWATTVRDALALTSTCRPDLILLSWTLSEMNGDDLAELLACTPETASIPLVPLTLEPWVLSEELRRRSAQVVNKAYICDELALRVRDALGVAQDERTPVQEIARIRDRAQWWAGEDDDDWYVLRDTRDSFLSSWQFQRI